MRAVIYRILGNYPFIWNTALTTRQNFQQQGLEKQEEQFDDYGDDEASYLFDSELDTSKWQSYTHSPSFPLFLGSVSL